MWNFGNNTFEMKNGCGTLLLFFFVLIIIMILFDILFIVKIGRFDLYCVDMIFIIF